jgi:hypothetical protein
MWPGQIQGFHAAIDWTSGADSVQDLRTLALLPRHINGPSVRVRAATIFGGPARVSA